MPEILEFKVSSALKSIVGKDLITNDYVAIFEIVKNSFDALATYVTLTFEDDSLIIADNGKGMSLDDIKNKYSLHILQKKTVLKILATLKGTISEIKFKKEDIMLELKALVVFLVIG